MTGTRRAFRRGRNGTALTWTGVRVRGAETRAAAHLVIVLNGRSRLNETTVQTIELQLGYNYYDV